MLEFTIERDVLLKGIQRTLGIVERKSTIPVLGNVLIRSVAKDTLQIVATDRELCLMIDYRASVVKSGKLTIPAKKLYETVRELQGETLHMIEISGNTAQMTCEKTVCRLRGLPAEDFPTVPDLADDEGWKIGAGALFRSLIGQVSFAICTDSERKNLEGVFLQRDPSSGKTMIRMVSADGHRLALAETDMTDFERRSGEPVCIPEKGIIIPRKGLQEIRKLLDGEESDVSIQVEDQRFIIRNEKNTRLSVSLIDGEFPDYRRVIPDPGDEDTVVKFEKSSILHCLRRMSVIDNVECVLQISADLLVLSATHADVGDIRDEIPAKYDGAFKTVKFNVEYLIEAIEVVPGDLVELRIPNGRDMAVIKAADDASYLCIVMAMKG